MKFSLSWLNEFVDVAKAGGGDAVCRVLAQGGLPVEGAAVSAGDVILDVEITPNRPDAMSHRGLAREVAAMAGIAFHARPAAEPASSGPRVEDLTSVTNEVPRVCRRFGARVVSGIGGSPAPEIVRRRLSAIGAKSISAAVDATNAVLWETGQPLHAFDLDALAGRRLVVRRARKGERLVTLDGIERVLETSDIVVADAEKAVSLAGIMGGLSTAVTPATKNVVLEAAWWDPASIRKTARRLDLHTDASHRFERGADPEAIPDALDRAAAILLEAAGGQLAPGFIDARGAAWKIRRAALRLTRLRLLAGDDNLELAMAAEALQRLGFEVVTRGRRLAVTVPSWRPDVGIEDDLVEEVLRVRGYDRLPSRLPASRGGGGHLEPLREVEELLTDRAVAAGLLETMSAPFSNRRSEEGSFGGWLAATGAAKQPLALSHPLDENRPNLRATLLPGLLDAAALNLHHGDRAVGLFEVGRVFDREGAADDPASFESRRAAFALAGEWRGHWSSPGGSRGADFSDAKGVLERLLEPWAAPHTLVWKPFACEAFTPGAAAAVTTAEGTMLAVLGLAAGSEREKRKTSEEIFVGEIVVEAIPPRGSRVLFTPYSAYPPIEADLSFAHARTKAWSEIEADVRGRGLKHLESVRVVDRYEGERVAKGQVKTTIRLTFRCADRTLEQEEVNEQVRLLAAALQQKGE